VIIAYLLFLVVRRKSQKRMISPNNKDVSRCLNLAVSFSEVVRRAETGPMVTEKDFNLGMSKKIAELCKEYDIRYNREEVVPTNDSLADDVWKAGFKLFLDTGVYYMSTKRVVKFSEEEVKESIKHLPSEVSLGEGKDRVIIQHRSVEDKLVPIIDGGPFGAEVDLDMYVKINQAYAQEPGNKILSHAGRIENAFGLKIRENSPLQIIIVKTCAQRLMEVLSNAGRPGMPMMAGVVAGVAGLQDLVADEFLRPSDIRALFLYPDLKTDDIQLSKAIQWSSKGYNMFGGGTPLIGGWCGGPDGGAVEAVAVPLACMIVYKMNILGSGLSHIKYHTTTNHESLWATSLVSQALSRNLPQSGGIASRTSAGPCTEQIFYEITAMAVAGCASGTGQLSSPRIAKTKFPNHASPLELRFLAEVAEAAAGIKREDANEIAKLLVSRYKDRMEPDKAPVGKPFEQVYDTETLQPRKEALELYQKMKKEIEDIIEFKKR